MADRLTLMQAIAHHLPAFCRARFLVAREIAKISLVMSGKSLALIRPSRARSEGRCASSSTLGAGCDGRLVREDERAIQADGEAAWS
jgi:hypothetical protein